MERRDIDDELSTAGAQELLASTSAAHLAYIGKDGTPRVIPDGFFWTGEQFVISSATTSPKLRFASQCRRSEEPDGEEGAIPGLGHPHPRGSAEWL